MNSAWILPSMEELSTLSEELRKALAKNIVIYGRKFDKNIFLLAHITDLIIERYKESEDSIQLPYLHIEKSYVKQFHTECKKSWNISIRQKDFWRILKVLSGAGAIFEIHTLGNVFYGVNCNASSKLLSDFNNWLENEANKIEKFEKIKESEVDNDSEEQGQHDIGKD